MIRQLKSGKYRLYSGKKDSKTGKRKNLGTFNSKAAAKKHERAVQYSNGIRSVWKCCSHRPVAGYVFTDISKAERPFCRLD